MLLLKFNCFFEFIYLFILHTHMQLEVAMVECTLYVEYADLFWQFICIIYELQIYSDNSECLLITFEDSQPDAESQQS